MSRRIRWVGHIPPRARTPETDRALREALEHEHETRDLTPAEAELLLELQGRAEDHRTRAHRNRLDILGLLLVLGLMALVVGLVGCSSDPVEPMEHGEACDTLPTGIMPTPPVPGVKLCPGGEG